MSEKNVIFVRVFHFFLNVRTPIQQIYLVSPGVGSETFETTIRKAGYYRKI